MSVIRSVIQDEYERNLRMQRAYHQELSGLPKVALVRKRIHGREYYYWAYREGNRVLNLYVSPKEHDLDALKKQDERRRQLKALLRNLKAEQREMERFLRISAHG